MMILDFGDIIANRITSTTVIDIIGELITIENVKEVKSNGSKRKLLEFELQDSNNIKLQCSLWGDYAVQVSQYIQKANSGIIIIVIQLAKTKPYGGKITITNALYASILINPDIPEVVDLKKSQIPTEKAYSIEGDFLLLTERKTLDEIREAREVCTCVTLATIQKIQTDYNWFYNACKKYQRKINAENGKFWCEKYNENARFVIPRYRVQVLVIDHTCTASFILFDHEAKQFIHKSAVELRERLTKEDDDDSFPQELDVLVKRKLLFKIQVSEFNLNQNWPVFSVSKMTNDENLIVAFRDNLDLNQESTGQEYFTNEAESTKKKDGLDNGSLSVTGDNEVKICSSDNITPCKRNLLESDVEH
ncbi:replication protein A 70 kDa DNA-binding subunit-like [Asparagus officinalis]|uniref:replication protein A 70 kDa DNA-binding subunit-like n=1 Tax=Asparagus officinalis TaxID=4686 RepID=UPI00098E05A4|nr:replication protein A 70 kDa DNA-binding subunit-like [Asparagus officinalis]